MTSERRIYHITHRENLAGILREQRLWADRRIRETEIEVEDVGMQPIKQMRRCKAVPCHPGTSVGDYVPFTFCPRSVMLFLFYRKNHPKLTYRGGQEPILHLSARLDYVVAQLEKTDRLWAFTNVNANMGYARFYTNTARFDDLKWSHITAQDFRDPEVKDAKQAEFLVHESFPLEWIDEIGVIDRTVQQWVHKILADSPHQPTVHVRRHWYY